MNGPNWQKIAAVFGGVLLMVLAWQGSRIVTRLDALELGQVALRLELRTSIAGLGSGLSGIEAARRNRYRVEIDHDGERP